MARLWQALRRWAEMVRLSHSVFALPFALMAAVLAGRDLPEGHIGAGHVLWVLVCMVGARSAAMTFNRIADAEIDRRNPRTASRAIPAGQMTLRQAWAFFVASAVVFEIGCAGFWWQYGNVWPIALSLPVLAWLCGYSYTKRFTRWSHFYLGSAIAFSPVAAWVAVCPATVGLPALLLMGAVTLWIGGFDIIYALLDVEVDRREGLHSLPARMGPGPALWIARAAHAGTLALLLAVAPAASLGWVYLLGVAVVAALLVVEHAIVRPDDCSRVPLASFTINGIVSVVLAAAAVLDVWLA